MKQTATMLIAFLIGFAYAVKSQTNQEPFMVKSLAGQSIRHVHAETSGGNISVQSAAEQRIEVYVNPNNGRDNSTISREELEKRLNENYDLSITTSNNTLTAIAKPRPKMNNWKNAVSVSFRVYVASDVSTKLRTSGGNISLLSLNGTQDFTTSGGNLNLEKIKGTLTGRTSGGNITLKEISDNIDLSTSGGNISADNCTGKMELSTSGGSIKLNNLNGEIDATTSGGSVKGESIRGNLSAHTSGGNVSMTDLHCALNASTSGGNIDVEIRELTGAVKVTNSGGNIDIDLPAGKGMDLYLSGSRIKTDKLTNFSGTVEEDLINGKVNGGGTSITVKAGSGRVSLSLH